VTIQHSRVPDDDGRRDAALAGHTGDETAARKALGSDIAKVRATALAALVRMQRANAEDLERGVADADPIVRRRACELAVTFPVDLVPLLHDADAAVVEAAAWALGERAENAGDAAVIELARVTTEHDEPLCREAAVAALGAIGDPAGLPAILAATSDKPAVRRRAVLALAPFEGPEVDAALTRALDDRDWQVRQAAEDLLRDD
jgi:HEAT repeat protein